MAQRFFEPGEYLGAPVYDAEGLLYGRVCGVDYRPLVRLRVCLEPGVEARIPDPEALRRALAERGIEVGEQAPLEELILMAREQGIVVEEVPASRLPRLLKGYIEPHEIAIVDVMEDGRLVVLLEEPREARLTGRRGLEQPPPDPELVLGKPVISPSEGYLGRAEAITIGAGGIALRTVKRMGGYLSVGEAAERLRRLGYPGVAEQLQRLAREGSIGPREAEALEEGLRSLGAPGTALEAIRSSMRFARVERRDIPWQRLLRLGDAVVTS